MSEDFDSSRHRQLEEDFILHVERLLADPRVRLDTTRGRRPIVGFHRIVNKSDRSIDLRRLMSEMGKPDRDLESRMPHGKVVDVTMAERRFFFFRSPVGRLRAVCASPTRLLLSGQAARPLDGGDVARILAEQPPPLANVPSTMVLLSTSGFTIDAREAAERRADRTVLLVEPNGAGGWAVHGPPATAALSDLFDPESELDKRDRIRQQIDAVKTDLEGSGAAADRIAEKTQLPLSLVESELKSFAKANAGLVAKRLDGRMVLFRQSADPAPAAGGSKMAFIDNVKALFLRKGDTEKKIAFLAERRALLSQQRDRGYEDMGTLEKREAELRAEFNTVAGDLSRRRITSQLLQLRKDIERRQQLLSVLNQQINVVGTHLHNLQLVQQGSHANLPDSDELASDAAAAEDVLATLEADNELADSVGASVHGGLSAEEQALYEELMQDHAKQTQAAQDAAQDAGSPNASAAATSVSPQRTSAPAAPQRTSSPSTPQRSEPEAG
jgi:hypothetical protein